MYKKWIALIIVVVLVIGFAGFCCSGKAERTNVSVSETMNEEVVAVETEMSEEVESETETESEEHVPGAIYNPDEIMEDLDNVEVDVAETDVENKETVKEAEETIEEASIAEGLEPVETMVQNTSETENAESDNSTENKAEYPEHVISEYEKYLNMSGKEQKAYMESFSSVEAFFEWLDSAKAEHEKLNPVIEITGDTVDINEVLDNE